jgi:hypothetical protein
LSVGLRPVKSLPSNGGLLTSKSVSRKLTHNLLIGSDSVCFFPQLHEKQIPRYARDDSVVLKIDLKLSHDLLILWIDKIGLLQQDKPVGE